MILKGQAVVPNFSGAYSVRAEDRPPLHSQSVRKTLLWAPSGLRISTAHFQSLGSTPIALPKCSENQRKTKILKRQAVVPKVTVDNPQNGQIAAKSCPQSRCFVRYGRRPAKLRSNSANKLSHFQHFNISNVAIFKCWKVELSAILRSLLAPNA